jgi:hypothetical protein
VREGLEAQAFADDDARWALADAARRARTHTALAPPTAARDADADADELRAEKAAAAAAGEMDEADAGGAAAAVTCAAEWLGQEEAGREEGRRGSGVEAAAEAIVDKRRALRAVMAAISLP